MFCYSIIYMCLSTMVLSVVCLDRDNLYTPEEITWLDDPSNYTVVLDFQNKTISLCTINACQHISSLPTDILTYNQPVVLLIQKGVNIQYQLNTYPTCLSTFHRVSSKEFHSCNLSDARNDTVFVSNTSTDVFTIPGDSFVVGENLLLCDHYLIDDNNTCPVGCRLNLTVRDEPCSVEFGRTFCFDNGNCTSSLNETSFTCKCSPGYTGQDCMTYQEVDSLDNECMIKNCQNGGTCVPVLSPTHTSGRTRCECPLHVSGELCETVLNSCASSPCVNGVCVEKEEGYQCFCVPGFHGKTCELEYNECLSNPCLNHGTCIDRVDRYECRCLTGYNGIRCEHQIDFCDSKPCKHNSTCISADKAFHCKCSHGYTGKLCEHRIRECSSSPCKNHGTCIEFNHGYKCLCPVTFAGLHCEYMMDVFAPPMEGTGMSSDSHKHNLYIVAATLGSMILIIVSVIIACYCKIYETYKQVVWKRLRYQRKRSNSCPDMESCTETANVNKHRLSADAIWEATSLCHDNAAFEHHGNHQTFTNMQI